MIPSYRTELYAIWKACERFQILPPGIKSRWEDLDNNAKAELIAYGQIRDHEDVPHLGGLM